MQKENLTAMMRFDNRQQQQFFAELLAQAQYPGHVVRFAAEQMQAVEGAEIADETAADEAARRLNEQRNRNRDETNALPPVD